MVALGQRGSLIRVPRPQAPEHPREAYREVMDITLLYFDDCPNWHEAEAHLLDLAATRPDLRIVRQIVDTPEDAERLAFRGSPSIVVDGVDLFAAADDPVGLSCRVYQTPDGPAGSPTLEQLRQAMASQPS